MDAVGSNIRVDARGREVMRILPRTHEDVNEEWISDKTRFVWDGLRSQRLDRPYIREIGKLRAATWPEAFARIAAEDQGHQPERDRHHPGRSGRRRGSLLAQAARQVARHRAISIAARTARRSASTGGRAGYLFNSDIAGIEQADAILLIGTNPRLEAPVLNARIRKRWRKGNCFDRRHRREGRSHLCIYAIWAPGPKASPRLADACADAEGARSR